jgi:glucose-6-phosphate dehydrogenase assembly protein OpcA
MIDDLYWQRLGLWRAHWANLTDFADALNVIVAPDEIAITWPATKSTGWRMILGWLIDRLECHIMDMEPNHISLHTEDGRTIPVNVCSGDDPSFSFIQGDLSLSSAEIGNRLNTQLVRGGETLHEMLDPCNMADPVTDIVKLLNRGHDQLYDQALSALILNEHI